MNERTADVPASSPRARWLALGGVALLWCLLYLPGLGGEELKGEEPRRALPGLEMARSGDWLHPKVGGQSYHRKPPLINWLCAAGTMATGRIDEFSVRWPVAVLVLGLGLALVLGVGRAAGAEAGFLAAVFALTNLSMLDKGRLCEIEGAYVSLTGMAFAAWFGWIGGAGVEKRRPWLGWAVTGLLLGIAFLAKGPPHLVMFYAVVGGVLWRGRRWREVFHPAHFLGVILLVAVALPWFVAASGPSAPGPVSAGAVDPALDPGGTWWEQIRSRLDFTAIHWGTWSLQIFQGMANFLPWLLLLIPLSVPALRRRWGLDDDLPVVRGLALGVVVGYFLIALTPASHGRFTMPLIGPAAAFVAMGLSHDRTFAALERAWGKTLLVLCGVVAAAGTGVVIWAVRRGGGTGALLALPGVVLSCVLGWRLLSRDGRWPLAAASGLLLGGMGILYVRIGQPLKAEHEEIRPVATGVGATLRPGERAVVYKGEIQPWVFYLWNRTIEVADREALPDPLPGPLVLRKAQWEKELEKLEKRCGHVTEIVPVANPWDPARPLVLVRWEKAAP